ncbi:endonuclease V [Macadamia integrifolia]|uniref:endonuclease V n=1 Tax=Macadamia integrifolia TaxID=60698 RepID=UPI001C530224|nr:endonuclease V [Macadamia integrifolia]
MDLCDVNLMEKINETSTSEASLSSINNSWIEAQESLKRQLIVEDNFTWRLPSHDNGLKDNDKGEKLRYVGGVDLSFSKDDPSIACGALVVVDLEILKVIYDDFSIVRLQIPYIPGFLAFREAPVLLELLEKMKQNAHLIYPQLLMVDGNGILHPRGFGLACHLGVMAKLPTIGIGKNLHHVDGLTQSGVRELLEANESCARDLIPLTGNSNYTWGVAMRSTEGSLKPIFISSGHRVSIDTAVKIVKMTCKYRVPEPIRQADIRSRDYLQKHIGVAKLIKTPSKHVADRRLCLANDIKRMAKN